MKTPRFFVACRQCGTVTEQKHIIDTQELCQTCYNTTIATLTTKQCICGSKFTLRNPLSRLFTARNYHGHLAVYALCQRHHHLAMHIAKMDHPIRYFLNLLTMNH
jgi:hypothetical protein